MKTIRTLLLSAVALAAIAFVSAPQPVHAADADHGVTLSALNVDFAPLPLLAQAESPVSADTKAVVPTSAPLDSAGIIGIVIAAVTSLYGIWAHKEKNAAVKEKTTAQKVSETLVVAIEAASKIPAVQEKEKEIKKLISDKAKEAGVEPVLNLLVKRFTL